MSLYIHALRQAYRTGYASQRAGYALATNPHPAESACDEVGPFLYWRLGWEAARVGLLSELENLRAQAA